MELLIGLCVLIGLVSFAAMETVAHHAGLSIFSGWTFCYVPFKDKKFFNKLKIDAYHIFKWVSVMCLLGATYLTMGVGVLGWLVGGSFMMMVVHKLFYERLFLRKEFRYKG
jgi:ABC-type anion transport system duplicated permease subunit